MDPSGELPAALLARLVASDPGRPRVTVYDDTDGPTRGERVELSARVLANWVAKAANLLRDDLDAGPGTVVRLDLPPHWRTLYWALAAWSVGALVDVPPARTAPGAARPTTTPDDARVPSAAAPVPAPAPADVVVTDAPPAEDTPDHVVVVTLAALARSASAPVPPGAVDEARELASHGDVFDPWEDPPAEAEALREPRGVIRYAGLVPAPGPSRRVHTATADTAAFLHTALRAWSGDGSVVLTRGRPEPDVLDARLRAEGVTEQA